MSTGANVIDTVLDMLEENKVTPIFWTRAELFVHLNDGMMELNLMAGKYQSEQAFAPTVNTIQTTPAGIIGILHIGTSSKVLIRKRSLEGMDREKRSWANEVSPNNVIKRWGPVGLNLFFVYPKLNAPGMTVNLTTLDMPGVIGEGTTIPLDEEYVEALIDYTFHMARFKEGGQEFSLAMKNYEEFRETCGYIMRRKLSENYVLWSKEPHADTGPRYSTGARS
jgi:hypothetical protein